MGMQRVRAASPVAFGSRHLDLLDRFWQNKANADNSMVSSERTAAVARRVRCAGFVLISSGAGSAKRRLNPTHESAVIPVVYLILLMRSLRC
jgi:hypothetical protein